ncbi:MAG TPA: IPT/TIG domain-containing protein, partial [Gaiellaceae bacterium]|nr:IPT/TIG domain-containing protein [Gaiellaceae bacterium]
MTINGSGFTGVDLGANPDNVQFGGGADAASYTVVNDSKITAVVPTDAIPGSITVTNDAGTTLTDDAFIAQPQPTITGMDPAVGGTGTIVSITGSGFDDGTDEGDQHSDLTPVVTFVAAKGTKPVKSTDVEVQDDGDLTALVPSGAATGKITVTTKGGSVQTDSFTVVPPPTIKSIAPTIALPGSTITITGTGLLTTTDVYFGPNQLDANIDSGDITIKNDTSITVTIPADGTNADDGPVTVFNQAFTPDNSIGATSKQSFNFIVDPAPDLFSLDHGKTGTIFTLQSDSGGGFLGATKVWFTANNAATDISAKFKVIDDTDMTVTVPAGAVTGPVCVENPSTDANGETGPPPGVCTPDDFTIVTKPVVQDFSALGSGSGTSATDPATVGDDISITGTGFTFATKVTIGGAPADWSYDPGSPSDTEIDTTIPPGAKTGTITVTTAAGTGTSKAKVYIIPPPLISSITPYQEVDHTIVIKGSAFANVTEVDFGSSQVTDQASTHDGLD